MKSYVPTSCLLAFCQGNILCDFFTKSNINEVAGQWMAIWKGFFTFFFAYTAAYGFQTHSMVTYHLSDQEEMVLDVTQTKIGAGTERVSQHRSQSRRQFRRRCQRRRRRWCRHTCFCCFWMYLIM